MRSTLISAAVLLRLLLSAPIIMAQLPGEPTEHTLLWRIQGKGLEKPCYLFGTMHITNKSAFYFSDSLYAALEGASGFAMEVDPDSLVSMVFRHALQESKSKMLRDILDKNQLSRINEKVKKEFGIDADKLTARDAYLLKEKMSMPDSKGEEMPTFMDAYLFSIAKDRTKRIAGLERPEDQEVLLDHMESKFDPKTLVGDDLENGRFSDNLMKVYIDQNLPLVDTIANFSSDSLEMATMDKRNHVMVHSMDSLFQTGSFFVAVGAAHLPGSIGLIRLLRGEGYTVQPVFSSRKMAPGSYVFMREKEKEWVQVRVPEEGYEIYLPGRSDDYPVTAGVKLKVYMDLTNSTFFEAGSGPSLIKPSEGTRDSLLNAMIDNMVKKVNAIVIKKGSVIQDSLHGMEVEMFSAINKMTLKARVFISGTHLYILALGSQSKGSITRYMEDRFFGSLSIFPPEATAISNQVQAPSYYCSFVVPGKDEVNELPAQEGSQSSFHQVSDPVTGNIFTVTLTKANPGYCLPLDSVSLHSTLDRVTAIWPSPNILSNDTTFLGQTALSIRGTVGGAHVWGILLKRGNYQYNLLAFGQDDSLLHVEVGPFFASLRLLPLGDMPWSRKKATDSTFTLVAPDHSGTQEDQWVDTIRMETYSMNGSALSPYAFGSSDTAFLRKKFLSNHRGKTTYQLKWSTYQGLREMTFRVRSPYRGYVERGAYFLNGDKVYTQLALVLPGRENAPDVNAFFDSLQFAKTAAFAGFPAKGVDKLLASLGSSDSATRATALAFLDSADFEAGDLPLMLKALLGKTFADSLGYYMPWYSLKSACTKLLSENSLPLLCNTYRDLSPDPDHRRYELLSMVGSIHTKASFDSLVSLLSYQLPEGGSAYEMMWKLEDTLALAKQIYPTLMRFQGDSVLGPALFRLYNKLADSGFVSIDDFRAHRVDLLHFAYDYASRHGNDSSSDRSFDEMTDFLKRFRDTATERFFKAGSTLTNPSDKFSSTCALMFMGYPVVPKALQTLAADDFYRQALYDSLVSYKKAALFPALYVTQRAFAASALVRNLNSDQEDEDGELTRPAMHFIREGVYPFKGKKAKFLLFEVRFPGSDSTNLGIAGPYEPGSRQLRVDEKTDASGFFYEDRLDRKRLDAQVREYLEAQQPANP